MRHPIRWMLWSVGLGTAALLVAGSGASQGDSYALPPELRQDLTDLRGAFEALDRNERGACLAELERLIPRLPANSIPRDAALVLHGQLTGAFADRQAAWLDRRVADIVVLVPDEPSFIEAVSAWSPELFWPVLIEDDWYTPLFVEAFAPRRVVRWSPPDRAERDGADERSMALRLAAAIRHHNTRFSARGDPAQTDGDAEAPAPPGIVVLDPYGRQRAAGLALAIGRGQPVLALRPRGDHRRNTTEAYVEQLNETIMSAMASMGMLQPEAWSGITLAGDFPYRYDEPEGDHNPLCADDRLGRDRRLVRRAVTGRLLGDPRQSVYQAMASLFVQPRDALLADTYGHDPNRPTQGRGAWHLTHAAEVLRDRLDSVALLQNDRATVAEHRRAVAGAAGFDLWWINSSGGATSLNMSGGGLATDDVPIGRAAAMYIVASFSARNPWDPRTICGTALAGGAYWYFGSVHEPYLQAFPVSSAVAHRSAAPTPLAFAARHLPGDRFHRPWKLILIGDPLFALRPMPARRTDQPPTLPGWDAAVELGGADQGADGPARRFGGALLRGDPAAADLAGAAVREGAGAGLTPGQLAHAVRLLYEADRAEDLAALSPPRTDRHPMAGVYMRRVLRPIFDRELDNERLDAARDMLGRLLGHGVEPSEARTAAERWVRAMRRAGRGGEAARFVLLIAEDQAWPDPIRGAVRRALEAAAGD